MADKEENELIEYVSAPSKRAAALSSTISLVYLLHAIGIADLTAASRLPITGTPVQSEYTEHLVYWAMVFFFVMWGVRYDYERKYQGEKLQAQTQSIRRDFDHKSRNHWRLETLEQYETRLEERLGNVDLYKDCYLKDDSKEAGYKYSLCPDDEQNPLQRDQEWKRYIEKRTANDSKERARASAKSDLDRINNIEMGLSFHSRFNFEIVPIAAFACAVLSALVAHFGVFPLL